MKDRRGEGRAAVKESSSESQCDPTANERSIDAIDFEAGFVRGLMEVRAGASERLLPMQVPGPMRGRTCKQARADRQGAKAKASKAQSKAISGERGPAHVRADACQGRQMQRRAHEKADTSEGVLHASERAFGRARAVAPCERRQTLRARAGASVARAVAKEDASEDRGPMRHASEAEPRGPTSVYNCRTDSKTTHYSSCLC